VRKTVITHKISDTPWYVALTGAKDVIITDVQVTLNLLHSKYSNTTFQLFNADMVAGQMHLYLAAANAADAVIKGTTVSRNLEVETILYASCQDQISKAFTLMGVTVKTRRVAVIVFSESGEEATLRAEKIAELIGEVDDGVLTVTQEKYLLLKKVFNVKDLSIETLGEDPYDALTSLIIEKVALMPIMR
jgi:tRNA threonylcarbamoyladenosine modification (KEOPS) complex Cgi121 subunit